MPRIDFVSRRWDYDNGTALCLDSHENGNRWRIDVRFFDSDSWEDIANRFRNFADNIEKHSHGVIIGKTSDEVLMEKEREKTDA